MFFVAIYTYIFYIIFRMFPNFPEKMPYIEKAIYAFEEIDGEEFCFFGLRTKVSKMIFF